jgi:hypothetical protein
MNPITRRTKQRVAVVVAALFTIPILANGASGASPTNQAKQSCTVKLEHPIKSMEQVPLLGTPLTVRYKIPLWGSYAISGGFDAFGSDGQPRTDAEIQDLVHSLLRGWVHGKEKSLDDDGIELGMAKRDLAALRKAYASKSPYEITGYEVVGVDPNDPPLPTGAPSTCQPLRVSTEQSPERSSKVATADSAMYPCPFPLPGDAIPACDKERDDTKWAANSGYWDMHFNHISDADMVHILFMYTTWTTSSRLSLFTSDNDGFEVNTWFKFSPYPEPVTNTTIWGSDYPGAYLENLATGDDKPTYAVGSDQAEHLVAGRQYQNQIWINSPSPISLTGTEIGYYQQVDLDMISNGDAGFFSDEACGGEMSSCIRSMNVGQYESW